MAAIQVISFKNTVLFKRGIWLSAAALMAFVAGPAALSGAFAIDPVPSSIAISILCAALAYFFWKTQVHRLADEVIDCRDHLQVSRGRVVELIPLANIAKAEVSSQGGFHRIVLRLRTRTKLGQQIDFLPQASLWSNLPAIKHLALGLTERANQAQRGMTE
jgi:hypothetical protein